MSIFPTKVLFSTDGSEEAEIAGRIAVYLADRTDSELHVVHVGAFGFMPYPYMEEDPARLAREARGTLEQEIERIKANNGSVTEAHLRFAGAAEEVVALAEDMDVGLVVMGSRGRGGIRRALMGSVSDAVVRHAHCPVLVVRPQEQEQSYPLGGKILAAVDGSEESALAVRTAVDLADKTSSELHLVHVLPTYPLYSNVAIEMAEGIEVPQESQQEAQKLLDQQVSEIEEDGQTVTGAHLIEGQPDAQIVALADELGIGSVVVGSRGLGGMRRALIGSVSDSVIRHAPCPVMVVRAEKEQADTIPPETTPPADWHP